MRPRDDAFENIDTAPEGVPVWLRWAHGAAGMGVRTGPFWAVAPMPGAAPLGSACEDNGPTLWAPMHDPQDVAREIETLHRRRREISQHAG